MSETMQENMDAYGWFVGALDHPDKQVLLFRWMQSVTNEVRSLRMQMEQMEDKLARVPTGKLIFTDDE